jgi:MFS family permease
LTDFNKKRPGIFFGWYIVAASIAIILYTGGIANFGFTAIFGAIAAEFNWSYAQIALASSLQGFEVGLLSPVVGMLIDRWGARRLIFAGGVITCLGFLLLTRVNSLGMYYMAFVIIAFGMSAVSGTALLTAVAQWFRRKAGLATGLVASGFGLGGLLIPVVTKVIDLLKWRKAMLIFGLGILPIVLPLSLLFRRKPEDYGLLPDGDTTGTDEADEKTSSQPQTATDEEINVSLREALKQRTFWQIGIASACHSFVVGAVVTHMMPYLSSVGIARESASLFASMLPVVSIGGRLGSGWLADKLGSRQVFASSFFLMMGGLFFFGNSGAAQIWLLAPFLVLFGFGWGASVTSRISLLRRYFGRGSFGKILGFISGIMMIGNVSGAPLAGLIYDTFGSYKGAWFSFAILTLAGAALVISLPSNKKA